MYFCGFDSVKPNGFDYLDPLLSSFYGSFGKEWDFLALLLTWRCLNNILHDFFTWTPRKQLIKGGERATVHATRRQSKINTSSVRVKTSGSGYGTSTTSDSYRKITNYVGKRGAPGLFSRGMSCNLIIDNLVMRNHKKEWRTDCNGSTKTISRCACIACWLENDTVIKVIPIPTPSPPAWHPHPNPHAGLFSLFSFRLLQFNSLRFLNRYRNEWILGMFVTSS